MGEIDFFKPNHCTEIVQVMEIDGQKHVLGINCNFEEKVITINHHTRTIDTNKDNGDFTSTSLIDYRFLDLLIQRLTAYNEQLKQLK